MSERCVCGVVVKLLNVYPLGVDMREHGYLTMDFVSVGRVVKPSVFMVLGSREYYARVDICWC